MRARTLIALFVLLTCTPLVGHADELDLFTELNGLTVSLTSDGAPLGEGDTRSFPLGILVPFSYSFAPETPLGDTSLYDANIAKREIYYETWRGVPFSGEAKLVDEGRLPQGASGTFATTFPSAGQYFIVVFVSKNFISLDACNPDPNWDDNEIGFNCFFDLPFYFYNFFNNGPGSYEAVSPILWGGARFLVPGPQPIANVLLLPGTEATRLFSISGPRLWEPKSAADVATLAMTPEGQSRESIYAGPVVDYPLGVPALGDIYGSFEQYLNGLVASGAMQDWRAYGYDWREDPIAVVNDGTRRIDDSLEDMESAVEKLAATSKTGSVAIIAHSSGGLVAEALAKRLTDDGKEKLLDRIILVGTPEVGTPSAIGALLHGDGQALGAGLIASAADVRSASEFMPGAYTLLPSAAYSAGAAALAMLPDGTHITTPAALDTFLTGGDGRAAPAPSDTSDPLILSPTLLAAAAATHAALDQATPAPNVPLIQIAGEGLETTSGISYKTKKVRSCSFTSLTGARCKTVDQLTHTPLLTKKGDGVVVATSATANTLGERWYFDLSKIASKNVSHPSLLANGQLESFLTTLLYGHATTTPLFSRAEPAAAGKTLAVSAHSPVTLLATDENGNQSGFVLDPDSSDVLLEKEDIPGSSVLEMQDGKYIFLPEGSYQFSWDAYDAGEASFDIGSVEDDGSPSITQEFADVPLATSTTGSFAVSNDATQEMQVDEDGDGVADLTLTAPSAADAVDPRATLSTAIESSHAKQFVKNRFLSSLDDPAALKAMIESQLGRSLPYPEGSLLLQLAADLAARG